MRWLHKLNIPIRTISEDNKLRPFRSNKKKLYTDKDWLYQKYIVEKQSCYEISKICGSSYSTIYRWLQRYRIPCRTSIEAWRERSKKYKSHLIGRKQSKETKTKQSEAWTPERRTIQSEIMTNRIVSEETKAKLSMGKMGEKNPMFGMCREKAPGWKDGASFEPYCPLFNNKKREEIRNQYGRACIICGKSTLQNMSKNKMYWLGRLNVDHVDENKMQGCDNWEWRLVPLCHSCHCKMNNAQTHLLLQLLLINNKLEQINLEI